MTASPSLRIVFQAKSMIGKFASFALLILGGSLLCGCETVAEGIADGMVDSLCDTVFDGIIPPSKVNTTKDAHFTKRGSPYP